MDINYKKTDNQKLFKSLAENPAFGIVEPQNYIPLYNTFFSLSPANSGTINLNNKWQLQSLISQDSPNIYNCTIKEGCKKDGKENKKVYLKFSPLLDPLKYLIGKYDITDPKLLNLPAFESEESHAKTRDVNNSAYVDSFFTYLSSKLLHDYGFVHGLDFYGSFLALKTDFRINIIDDIDYLAESAFFKRNDKVLYELEDGDYDELNSDTRNYRKKLVFDTDTPDEPVLELNVLDEMHVEAINAVDIDINAVDIDINAVDININAVDLNDIVCKNKSESSSSSSHSSSSHSSSSHSSSSHSSSSHSSSRTGSCSSCSSNTDEEDDRSNSEAIDSEAIDSEAIDSEAIDSDGEAIDSDGEAIDSDGEADNSDGEDDRSDSEGDSDCSEEETLFAKIKKFPVQVIALEHCESTLDSLIIHGTITNDQWDSIVMQILFSLITFQKTFGLTHNDLHTNNIMYIETAAKFLYYKFNHIYYKVPTFGKLFKIIDYGRAIYKFRGQTLCSDSYHADGDAATQYNCEPYLNDKKPRLEPNFSFDLCRLGCALYDYLVDEPKSKIVQIMLDWVTDDKGRNILYKKNGDERYPDFKLYKMIARTVKKHIPLDVLINTYFDKFIATKKEMKNVMDIDEFPSFV